MSTYLDEKRRRIQQFTHYLRLMGLRTHKVVKGDCFIVFEESPPEDSDAPRLRESTAVRLGCSIAVGSESAEGFIEEMPSSDWWAGESAHRFIQFFSLRDCFHLERARSPTAEDLPDLSERVSYCGASNMAFPFSSSSTSLGSFSSKSNCARILSFSSASATPGCPC